MITGSYLNGKMQTLSNSDPRSVVAERGNVQQWNASGGAPKPWALPPVPLLGFPRLCPWTLRVWAAMQGPLPEQSALLQPAEPKRRDISFISLGHLFSGTSNSRQHVNFFQLLLPLLLLDSLPLLLWNDLIPVLVRTLFQLFLIFHGGEIGNLDTERQMTFPYFPNTSY